MGQILWLSLYFSFDVQNHWFVFLDSKGLVSGENFFTWMSFIKAFFVKCLMHFFGFGVVGKLILIVSNYEMFTMLIKNLLILRDYS